MNKTESNVIKYINESNKECYENVGYDTKFDILCFHEVQGSPGTDRQWALHTNLGTITVLDRRTGFSDGHRDTETGYRSPCGGFWLANGMCDVRESGSLTIGDAIEWVKNRADGIMV